MLKSIKRPEPICKKSLKGLVRLALLLKQKGTIGFELINTGFRTLDAFKNETVKWYGNVSVNGSDKLSHSDPKLK